MHAHTSEDTHGGLADGRRAPFSRGADLLAWLSVRVHTTFAPGFAPARMVPLELVMRAAIVIVLLQASSEAAALALPQPATSATPEPEPGCPSEIIKIESIDIEPAKGQFKVDETISMDVQFKLAGDFVWRALHEGVEIFGNGSCILKQMTVSHCRHSVSVTCPAADFASGGVYSVVLSAANSSQSVPVTTFFNASRSAECRVDCGRLGWCSLDVHGQPRCACASQHHGQYCEYSCNPQNTAKEGNQYYVDKDCLFKETFTCANASPTDRVVWTVNGEAHRNDSYSFVLDIQYVTRNASIQCDVENETLGSWNLTMRSSPAINATAYKRLSLKQPFDIMEENFLVCPANGGTYPQTFFSWFPTVNGNVDERRMKRNCIIESSQYSRIVQIKPTADCSGNYTCQFWNVFNQHHPITVEWEGLGEQPPGPDPQPTPVYTVVGYIVLSVGFLATLGIMTVGLIVRYRKAKAPTPRPDRSEYTQIEGDDGSSFSSPSPSLNGGSESPADSYQCPPTDPEPDFEPEQVSPEGHRAPAELAPGNQLRHRSLMVPSNPEIRYLPKPADTASDRPFLDPSNPIDKIDRQAPSCPPKVPLPDPNQPGDR